MKKKVLFIVNPKSGKGSIRSKLLDIVDIFVKAEFDLTLYISQSAGDARAKAKEVDGRGHQRDDGMREAQRYRLYSVWQYE